MSLHSKYKPDFSIIIPTFNRCNFLKKAITSVLKQKDVSFEIIVSDNCSVDNTEKVVKDFDDKRIKYFKNKKNIGFPLNVRKCFTKTSGKYVFTLSDDDFILDENTLLTVLKVMKKYKVGMANIGAIYWSHSPKVPCKVFILSNQLIVLKPRKDNKTFLEGLRINYSFYSGHIFDSSIVDENKVTESYGHSFYPLIFETIQKYGLVYIPDYFIVARISLRFIPHMLNLERLGSFIIEDYLSLLKKYLHGKDYEDHKKKYILGSVINLPSFKLFSNSRNYIRVLYRLILIDKTLLLYPNFIILALIGFMPRGVLKALREFMIHLYEKRTVRVVEQYDYFQKLHKLQDF